MITQDSIMQFARDTKELWLSGGWAMIAIATVAMLMFALGIHILIRLWSTGHRFVPERVWRQWLDDPSAARGRVGRVIATIATARSVGELSSHCEHIRAVESAPFARDLRVMKMCVTAAPLLGLLGTVTGMLTTFGALSSGAGGDATMVAVSDGISEALITTETGLVIAIPGLFFNYQLKRMHERYEAFLAHVETVGSQRLYRLLREQYDARRVAKAA